MAVPDSRSTVRRRSKPADVTCATCAVEFCGYPGLRLFCSSDCAEIDTTTVTVIDAAELLGITTAHAHRLRRSDDLPSGRPLLLSDLDDYLVRRHSRLTLSEAAELLGISQSSVQRMISEGTLPVVGEPTTNRRIARQAVIAVLEAELATMSVADAAACLEVSPPTVRRLVARGRLTSPQKHRVLREDVRNIVTDDGLARLPPDGLVDATRGAELVGTTPASLRRASRIGTVPLRARPPWSVLVPTGSSRADSPCPRSQRGAAGRARLHRR